MSTTANFEAVKVLSESAYDSLVTTPDNTLHFVELPMETYIVETYRKGTDWYCIWSDKTIEQGGTYTVGAVTSIELSLLLPYTTTEYQLFIQDRRNTNDTGGYGDYIMAITGASPYTNGQSTTGFRLSTTTGAGQQVSWYAIGK